MKRTFVITLFTSIVFISCGEVFSDRIRGNGNIQTEARTSGEFTDVDISGAIDLYIKQDSVYSIKVEADENLLPYIEVHNKGGRLQINKAGSVSLKPTRSIKVFVSGPEFKRFEASGACNIYSENKVIALGTIEIKLSGSSDVKMDIKAPGVDAKLSGAGTIELQGETKDFSVKGSGSTNIKCFDLMAENVDVRISGAGNADVFASVKLDVHVSGAANVKYKGNATVSQKVSGAGSVKKVE